jgi:hypothetical protein
MGKCKICNSRKSWEYVRGKNINWIRINTIKWYELKLTSLKLSLIETSFITTIRSSRNEK